MLSTILNLKRPLTIFDLETTGPNPATARIVQLAYRTFPVGALSIAYKTLVNPGVPIPASATAIHGITDEMVKDAPRFKDLDAGVLLPLTSEVDFGGFNIRYDLQVFTKELERLGAMFNVSGARVIDAFRLWQILEPRTLSDAVTHFLGRQHAGAHDAVADVDETVEILEEQLARLSNIITHTALCASNDPSCGFNAACSCMNLDVLHQLQFPRDPSWVDDAGRFVWNEIGLVCWNFGKMRGVPLSQSDPGLLRWVLKQDFTDQVKLIVSNALKGIYPTRVTEESHGENEGR